MPKRRLAVVANMSAKSVGKSRLLVGESRLLVGKRRLFNFAGVLLENGKRTNCPETPKGGRRKHQKAPFAEKAEKQSKEQETPNARRRLRPEQKEVD